MMAGKFVAGLLSLALLSQARAQTVLEKRAIKEGDQRIADAVEKFKKSCGAKALEVTSAHASSGKLKYEKEESNVIIASSGGQCASVIETIAMLCEMDKMNKDEMSKLTSVNCTYRIIEKQPFLIATKTGSVLNAELHPLRTYANEKFEILEGAF